MKRLTNKEFLNKCKESKPDIEILNEYKNERTFVHVKCKKCDYEWDVKPTTLMYLDSGCPNCSGVAKVTKEDFNKYIETTHPNYEVLTEFINTKTLVNIKCHTCNSIFSTCYNRLFCQNQGCPVCGNKKVKIGFNDMWTTNPELAKLLLNPDDGYKYTYGSNKKVDWICPDCGNVIKGKRVCDIYNHKLVCNRCSDGISYPEKIISNLFDNINYNIENHKYFNWAKQYEYDFYDAKTNTIIETNGNQHYEESFSRIKNAKRKCRTLKEEQINDKLKQEIAIKNGILHYIILDCRYSELEWIKVQIMDSEMNIIYDLNDVDWNIIHIKALKSKVIEVWNLWNNKFDISQIINITHLGKSTIMRYVKNGSEIGKCNYSVADGMKKSIDGLNKNRKLIKVICLNNNKIFDSLQQAGLFIGIESSNISYNCQGKRDYAGLDSKSKERLVWMYYDDYLKSTKDERQIKLNKALINHHTRKTICLNNLQIFNSMLDAAKWCNLNDTRGIRNCIENKLKHSGIHPITGERLKWMDYQEYIKNNKISEEINNE